MSIRLKSSSPSRSPLDTRSRSALLKSFLVHLASERGLANNTLLGYRRDVENLEDFFHAMGQPATARALPTPAPPDETRLVRECARTGIELL